MTMTWRYTCTDWGVSWTHASCCDGRSVWLPIGYRLSQVTTPGAVHGIPSTLQPVVRCFIFAITNHRGPDLIWGSKIHPWPTPHHMLIWRRNCSNHKKIISSWAQSSQPLFIPALHNMSGHASFMLHSAFLSSSTTSSSATYNKASMEAVATCSVDLSSPPCSGGMRPTASTWSSPPTSCSSKTTATSWGGAGGTWCWTRCSTSRTSRRSTGRPSSLWKGGTKERFTADLRRSVKRVLKTIFFVLFNILLWACRLCIITSHLRSNVFLDRFYFYLSCLPLTWLSCNF